jgi:hypothetical protein
MNLDKPFEKNHPKSRLFTTFKKNSNLEVNDKLFGKSPFQRIIQKSTLFRAFDEFYFFN